MARTVLHLQAVAKKAACLPLRTRADTKHHSTTEHNTRAGRDNTSTAMHETTSGSQGQEIASMSGATKAQAVSLSHLPTEILERITKFLPMGDLCSLRLTSRCLERGTFKVYAHRCFSSIGLTISSTRTASLEQVLPSVDFAASVHDCYIKFVEGRNIEKVVCDKLLTQMPNLQLLVVSGLHSANVTRKRPLLGLKRSLSRTGCRVVSLRILHCTLNFDQWVALLKSCRRSLKGLYLENVQCDGGHWPAILQVVKLLDLRKLHLSTLLPDEQSPLGMSFQMNDEHARTHRGLWGPNGIQHFSIAKWSGWFFGSVAVRKGLDAIGEYRNLRGLGS